jgi:hypothetical protein
METQNVALILSIITLVSTFTYIGVIDKEPNYYCESRQVKAFCYDLSSTKITCYTLPAKTGGSRCTESWKQIPTLPQEATLTNVKYLCSKDNCTKIG